MGLLIDASTPAVAVQTNNLTSTVTSASFSPPAGSILVIGWAWNTTSGNTPSTPTITDNLGVHLTYSLKFHRARPETATDSQTALWFAPVTTGGAMTVTATAGTNTGLHGGAMYVWVFTGHDPADPDGAGGEGGSAAAITSIAMSFTAEASNSMGLGAVSDWALAGAKTAGTGTTISASGNAGSEISYGFARRTSADSVAGNTTTVNVNTPSSNALMWVYIEVKELATAADIPLPPAVPPTNGTPWGMFTPWTGYDAAGTAATSEAGTASVALSAAGAAVKVASCSGTSRVAVSAAGSARKTVSRTGTSQLAATSTGAATKKAPCAGPAQFAVRASSVVAKTSPAVGSAAVALRAAGVGAKLTASTGTATAALASSGVATTGTAPAQSGTCTLALAGTSAGRKSVSRTATAVVALTAASNARKTSPAAGRTVAALACTATGIRRALPAGASVVATQTTAAARKTSTPTARSVIALTGSGAGSKRSAQAGRTLVALLGQPVVRGAAGRPQTGSSRLALRTYLQHECFVIRPDTGTIPHGGAAITRPSTGTVTHGGSVIVRPNTGIVENEC